MKFRLNLLGALTLIAPDGSTTTPRMAKTQGLLAYLALTNGRMVNRAALQDLLWSDRGHKQGRDSLRKALAELRRCLSAIEPNPLETTGGPVLLRPGAFEIDVFSDRAQGRTEDSLYRPVLLDGLDIRDDQFNRWLLDTRSRYEGKIELSHATEGHLRAPPAEPQMHSETHATPLFEVGIMPVEGAEAGDFAERSANLLLNDLITVFDQSSVITPYDFRQGAELPNSVATGPDVLFSLQATCLGEEIALSARARHVTQNRIVWSSAQSVSRRELCQAWVNAWTATTFDSLIERLSAYDGFEDADHCAARLVVSAVDLIFRLSPEDLSKAGTMLNQACEMVESSAIFGWNAFLTAFRAEKEGRAQNPQMLERAEWYAARATELDRHNPLTVALVAHVYSFVLRDIDRAAELLAPMRGMSGRSPFLADTMAMMHFYLGDYENARTMASQAVLAGRFSPFRFSFTTSLAMSEFMLGHTQDAVRHCKAAIAQHRVRRGHLYEPTLRTLAAAAGHAGNLDEGRSALDILARQGRYDPLERLRSGDTPYPNPEVLTLVRQGMERLHEC